MRISDWSSDVCSSDLPPVDSSAGGFIAQGYDAALDELRSTAGDGRRAIAALEARYRETTSIQALKIRHNNVLGFHIERSEEHTSELQSLMRISYAVFCLKKKKNKTYININTITNTNTT